MDENEIEDLVEDLKSAGFPCIVVLGNDQDEDQDDEIEESDDE